MKSKLIFVLIAILFINLLAIGSVWADDDEDEYKFKVKKGFLPPGLMKKSDKMLPPPFQNMIFDWKGEIKGEVILKEVIKDNTWIVIKSSEEIKALQIEGSKNLSLGDFVQVDYIFDRALEVKVVNKSSTDVVDVSKLNFTLTASPSTVRLGEEINLKLLVKNTTGSNITTQFRSGQRYDFIIKDANGNEVWQWSDDYDFITVIQNMTVKPNESITYSAQWEPKKTGSYTVEAYFKGYSSTKPVAKKQFNVVNSQVQNQLSYQLEIIKGQPNLLVLKVTNPKSQYLDITTPTSQSYDFLVTKSGEKIWQWSDGRSFTQATQNIRFAPQETKVYYAQFDRTAAGDYQVYAFFKGVGEKVIGPKNLSIN